MATAVKYHLDRADELVASAEQKAAHNEFRSAVYKLSDAIQELKAAIAALCAGEIS